MSIPKRTALETYRRELSEDASFGIGTLLSVEQSSLGNHPRGGWFNTVNRDYIPGQNGTWWHYLPVLTLPFGLQKNEEKTNQISAFGIKYFMIGLLGCVKALRWP